MKNTRTLISSSLVSLIIVLLGMFMLCMGQSPRISFDEPLIEGGGIAPDSVTSEDQELINMLSDSDDSQEFIENTGEPDASSEADSEASDDDLLSFLGDTNQSTTSDEQLTFNEEPSNDSDEGIDEILRMLELDEIADSDSQESPSNDDAIKELLTNDTDKVEETAETIDTTEQPPVSNSTQQIASNENLNNEVENLQTVLDDKTAEVENLQSEIKSYDQRIAEYQSAGASRSSTRRSTPTYESSESYQPYAGGTYISGDYEASYNAALDMYRNKDYQQAIATLFQLLQQDSRHPLADNCQYWLGECRYAQGKYYQAVVDFNKVLAYDAPDKQDDAQLMLGMAYLKLGEMNNARNEFDWLVSCYSSSEYVSTAYRYLGQF